MRKMNEDHGEREDLLLKIGIHEGPCLAVTLNERQDYFGTTVNIASRVEALTKAVGKPLLVTSAVRDRLRDGSHLEELPPQRVRGVEEPLTVFAVRSET